MVVCCCLCHRRGQVQGFRLAASSLGAWCCAGPSTLTPPLATPAPLQQGGHLCVRVPNRQLRSLPQGLPVPHHCHKVSRAMLSKAVAEGWARVHAMALPGGMPVCIPSHPPAIPHDVAAGRLSLARAATTATKMACGSACPGEWLVQVQSAGQAHCSAALLGECCRTAL